MYFSYVGGSMLRGIKYIHRYVVYTLRNRPMVPNTTKNIKNILRRRLALCFPLLGELEGHVVGKTEDKLDENI
jgi:hypothetical protein